MVFKEKFIYLTNNFYEVSKAQFFKKQKVRRLFATVEFFNSLKSMNINEKKILFKHLKFKYQFPDTFQSLPHNFSSQCRNNPIKFIGSTDTILKSIFAPSQENKPTNPSKTSRIKQHQSHFKSSNSFKSRGIGSLIND